MVRSPRTLPTLFLSAALGALGCRAQNPPSGAALSPDLARRIEVLLRQKAQLPPGSTVQVGPRHAGALPGFDEVTVTVSNMDGTVSRPINFQLSTDGKTLAQLTKFDLSADPKKLVSDSGRPARGGPEGAPVTIVGFDDLECPYCARLHSIIFPAITNRYHDQVRIVYRDFPLDQHPWAMRAAVDVNCLGAVSAPAYWDAVDFIHAHASDIGSDALGKTPDAKDAPKSPATPDRTLDRANQQLDKVVHDLAVSQKADPAKVDACIARQDTREIEASRKFATTLGVDSTPSLFINGDKIDGALPIEFIFKIIDQALVAEGRTPPPPYAPPAPAAPAK